MFTEKHVRFHTGEGPLLKTWTGAAIRGIIHLRKQAGPMLGREGWETANPNVREMKWNTAKTISVKVEQGFAEERWYRNTPKPRYLGPPKHLVWSSLSRRSIRERYFETKISFPKINITILFVVWLETTSLECRGNCRNTSSCNTKAHSCSHWRRFRRNSAERLRNASIPSVTHRRVTHRWKHGRGIRKKYGNFRGCEVL